MFNHGRAFAQIQKIKYLEKKKWKKIFISISRKDKDKQKLKVAYFNFLKLLQW